VLAWLSVWSKVQTCIWPSWCHCHSLSLASVKSRLVLLVWYWRTWVVPDKWPLNVCSTGSVYYYYLLNDDNSYVQLLSQFFGCATPTRPISIGAVVVLHPLLLSRHLWSWIQQVLGWPTIRKQTVCLWVVILSVRGSTHSYSPYCKPHFSPCSHFFHINTCNWQ